MADKIPSCDSCKNTVSEAGIFRKGQLSICTECLSKASYSYRDFCEKEVNEIWEDMSQ